MRLHRFLVKDIDFDKENPEQMVFNNKSHKELLHQLISVFRIKLKDRFVVFDGSGTEFLLECVDANKKEITCEIKEERQGIKRHKRLSLCFSMIKKENMELVINMCTQLGVTHFVPFISERTVKTGWNYERMNKIVSEAAEQSGFSDLPVIESEALKLSKLIERFKKERENLDGLCALDFSGTLLSSVKHLISVDTILVGPEGGFSENEISSFRENNIKIISLGDNVLRAETASVSIASIFLL